MKTATPIDMTDALPHWGKDSFDDWVETILCGHPDALPFQDVTALEYLDGFAHNETITVRVRVYVMGPPVGVMRFTIDRDTGQGTMTGFDAMFS